MDWEVSREDIKSKVERILSDILSDKYDMNITVRFEKAEESRDNEEGRSNQSTGRHRSNARKGTRRTKRKDATN